MPDIRDLLDLVGGVRARAQEEADAAGAKVDEARRLQAEAAARADEIRAQIGALEQFRIDLRAAEDEVASSAADLHRLDQSLPNLRSARDAAASRAATARAQLATLYPARDQIPGAQQRLDDANAQVAAAAATLATHEAAEPPEIDSDTPISFRVRLPRPNPLHAQWRLRLTQLQTALRNAQSAADARRTELSQLQSTAAGIPGLEAQLRREDAEVARRDAEIQAAEAALPAARARATAAVQRRDQLVASRADVVRARAEVQRLEGELTAASAALEAHAGTPPPEYLPTRVRILPRKLLDGEWTDPEPSEPEINPAYTAWAARLEELSRAVQSTRAALAAARRAADSPPGIEHDLARLTRLEQAQRQQAEYFGGEAATLEAQHRARLAAVAEVDKRIAAMRAKHTDRPADPILVGELATDAPVALLPVRLETRFVPAGDTMELRVRIYPDDLQVETHEPGLTAAEEAWGQDFWNEMWRAGRDREREQAAWERLAARFGGERAAWIGEALRPANLAARPSSPVADGARLTRKPSFPKVAPRESTWERAARTRAMPTRWVVIGYRDIGDRSLRVFTAWGEPVPPELAVGPAPRPEGAASGPPDLVDAGMRWMVDFDEAVRVGMGLRIPLLPEFASGLTRLVAIGVRGSDTGAESLETLLRAHRFTRGLTLLPQGTPTNNTRTSPSAYSSQRTYGIPFSLEGAATDADAESDAAVAARALGVPIALLADAGSAARAEQRDARAMNAALWPATWGYFFGLMFGGVMPAGTLARLRRHFVDSVRAAGAVPVMRVGKQPYGVLPVAALAGWKGAAGDPAAGLTGPEVAELVRVLGLLGAQWLRTAQRVPRVEASRAGEWRNGSGFVEALQMAPMSTGYRLHNLFVGAPPPGEASTMSAALRALGLAERPGTPAINFRPAPAPVGSPLVSGDPPDDRPLAANYIRWLRTASHSAVRSETGAPVPATNPPLLYLLLRHALLLEEAHAAFRMLRAENPAATLEWRDPQVVDASTMTPLRYLDRTDLRASGGAAAGEYLHGLLTDYLAKRAEGKSAKLPAEAAALGELGEALLRLESRSTAELVRLFSGTMDLASYRLDAWISSVAHGRLERMRGTRAAGAYVGGYGWVEDLAPRPAAVAEGGFVHAPSLAHAATAAVLRSGYLSQQGRDGGNPFAINLTSERVRTATGVLEGIRQGLSLDAILGYRFERALHDRALDRYIRTFRRLVPVESGDSRALMDASAAAENAVAAHEQAVKARNELRAEIALLDAEIGQLQARKSAAEATDQKLAELAAGVTTAEKAVGDAEKAVADWEQAKPKRPSRWTETVYENGKPRSVPSEQQIEYHANLAAWSAEKTRLTSEVAQRRKELQAARDAFEAAKPAQPSPAEIQGEIQLKQSARKDLAEKQLPAQETTVGNLELAATAAKQKLRDLTEALFGARTETLAVGHVVDGLALRARYRMGRETGTWDLSTIPFGDARFTIGGTGPALPRIDAGDGPQLRAVLEELDSAMDATADAVLAEGVHQMVQGNPLRAGATLDAAAQGGGNGEFPAVPPELEVTRTPRSGAAQTYRLVTLFGRKATRPAKWKVGPNHVRARAEPQLDAWVAQLLADPTKIRCRGEYVDPATGESLPKRKPVEVKLSDLGLSPLDLVYMEESDGRVQQSELEQRIRYHLLRKLPKTVKSAEVRIAYERSTAWAPDVVGFGELAEVLRAVRALVKGARALDARDLAIPGSVNESGIKLADLQARTEAAVAALEAAHAELPGPAATPPTIDPEALRDALMRLAAFGVPGAVPRWARDTGDPAADEVGRAALLEQAWTVAKETGRRRAKITAAREEFAKRKTPSVEAQRTHAEALLADAFGGEFRVLPTFAAPSRKALAASFGASATLYDNDAALVARWFQRVVRVREGAARFDEVLAYAQALGGKAVTDLAVGQLAVPPRPTAGAQVPITPPERWIALPFEPGKRPRAELSLVAHAPKKITATGDLAGLLLDEWVEVVPATHETTGVTFQFNEPNARAPQAILLAVPPDDRPRWTVDAIEQTVLAALELARVRAVDPELISGDGAQPSAAASEVMTAVRQLLPALYFARNDRAASGQPVPDTLSVVFPLATRA